MAVETKIATMILGTNPQLKYHRNTNVATKNGTKARADHMTRWMDFCRTPRVKKMFQGNPQGESGERELLVSVAQLSTQSRPELNLVYK